MRILLLTQYYHPEIGAPQARLFELAKGLRDLNWEVSVVTAMPNYPTGRIFPGYRRKYFVKELQDGIPIRRFWLIPSNSKRALPRLASMLTFSISILFSLPILLRQKPDFIFVESPPLMLGLSAFFLSKLVACRLILNVSDLWPRSAKELGAIKDGSLYRYIESIEKFLYKKAFICTGQSQEIVKHISKTKDQGVFLFRNGVDSKRFLPKSGDDKARPKKLVYAGLLGVAQGIQDICQNIRFRELGAEFHIYGAGAYREEIEKWLDKNPNSGIHLHRSVRREEIPKILGHYDGMLIPLAKRIYGAVPSKIYEAMAAGLPILFSGDGEAATLIEEHKVGWVSRTNDFDQLEINIADFVKDGAKRMAFKRNGPACAALVFDRKQQIEKLSNFLRSEAMRASGRE